MFGTLNLLTVPELVQEVINEAGFRCSDFYSHGAVECAWATWSIIAVDRNTGRVVICSSTCAATASPENLKQFTWVSSGIYFTTIMAGEAPLFKLDPTSKKVDKLQGPQGTQVNSFSLSNEGVIAVARSGFRHPADVFVGTGPGTTATRHVTDVHSWRAGQSCSDRASRTNVPRVEASRRRHGVRAVSRRNPRRVHERQTRTLCRSDRARSRLVR